MSLPPSVCQSGMLPFRMLGLLLLSLLPYGADLTCTSIKPLIMDAPTIIEIGTELRANCSTAEEHFEEMSLCLGNICCKNPPNEAVVSCVAPVSDLELKTECKIKLNDTFECSTELQITVYKTPEVILSVKNPSVMQPDYELTCDVVGAAPAQNFSVTWFKNNTLFKIEPFKDSHRGGENFSYILTVNIRREEKFAEFRCEAQLKLWQQEPQYPVISTTHTISACYAPELRTNSNQNIIVAKGVNTTLLCEVEANPPPEYQWTVDKQPLLETTNRLEINKVNSSSVYSCTATNALGNITMQVYVDVEEETTTTEPATMPTPEAKAPENCGLTVTPSYVNVKYGNSASIDCSTASKDIAKMSWEAGVGNSSDTPPTVTWRVEKLEDFTAKPFCYVTLNNDHQCTITPVITLYKLPDLVAVSAVGNGSMSEGKEHQLKCDIHGVAPAKKVLVKWYKEKETVFTDDLKSSGVTPLPECLESPIVSLCNVSSVYTFTAKKSDNGSVFRCEAEFQLGPGGPQVPPSMASKPYTAVVNYKPAIKNCPASYAGVENSFCLNDLHCEPDGNPRSAIKWYYNTVWIHPDKVLDRNDSGIYKATVDNIMGHVITDVHIEVEYAPSFSCQMQYDVEVNETPKTFCKPEGLPSPRISWLKNGNEIFPQRWKKNESGNYSLKASNKHGTARHMFYLDILYPPEFTESETIKGFIEGGNVSLVWKADGNPKPEIHCTYLLAKNVQSTTVGRQMIITITGATSTNVGNYSCVATNKVGNVTRTTTLVVKDKTTGLSSYWWVFLLVLLLFVVGLFFTLRRVKKQGRYSFVANDDKRNIPLQSNSTVQNGRTEATG